MSRLPRLALLLEAQARQQLQHLPRCELAACALGGARLPAAAPALARGVAASPDSWEAGAAPAKARAAGRTWPSGRPREAAASTSGNIPAEAHGEPDKARRHMRMRTSLFGSHPTAQHCFAVMAEHAGTASAMEHVHGLVGLTRALMAARSVVTPTTAQMSALLEWLAPLPERVHELRPRGVATALYAIARLRSFGAQWAAAMTAQAGARATDTLLGMAAVAAPEMSALARVWVQGVGSRVGFEGSGLKAGVDGGAWL